MDAKTPWIVYAIRPGKLGSVWRRVGWAEWQDDAVTLHLHQLPLDGQLHVRQAFGDEGWVGRPVPRRPATS